MPRLRNTQYAIFFFFLAACASPAPIPLSSESSLFAFNLAAFSLIEFDSNFDLAREIPLNLPCPLTSTHPASTGKYLALELECMNGPVVLIVDTINGALANPFPEADSHFLAWDFDSNLYLRVDALGNTRIVRVTAEGVSKQFDLPAQTYDMNFAPDGDSLIYSFTRGLGLGSELWAATRPANRARQLHAETDSIITFARWSPDGKQIAFIALPDSATPFPVGELWLMDADGKNARPLAPADAGHGYAPAWSPDSTRIAYVGRENPDDPRADQSADALISNIYIAEVATGQISPVTSFDSMLVESPRWSADGRFLAFTVVNRLDDTITPWVADLASGEIKKLASPDPLCCLAWMRK